MADINNVNTHAQTVQDNLSSIQHLPQQGQLLSTNATAIVSQLTHDLSTIPTVDEDFLNEVEQLVALAENEINTIDLTDLYSQLLSRYNDHEVVLDLLQSNIQSVEERISRLTQISESLPTDCAG